MIEANHTNTNLEQCNNCIRRYFALYAKLFLMTFYCVALLFHITEAQSLHFSQWFNSPLTTNPANTGFIPDADYRIGANYRTQWSNVMSVPYKTMSIFGDAQVLRNKIENGWIGLGGMILSDVAGAGKLTTNKIYASLAYHQMMGNSSLLTAGFNVGRISKRINTSDLRFPDQFDGKFFSNQLPTSVVLDVRSISYFDLQTGINYAYFPTDKIYLNGGIAIWHINRPRESFFLTDQNGFDSRLSLRYSGFLNGSFKVSEEVIINPMAYYTIQARASELTAGIYTQYNLKDAGEMQLLAGLYYRMDDAIIPMVGLTWNNIRLLFSYDVTISSLNKYNQSRGAWEFALINYGLYNEHNGDKRQSLCPKFK
ncbi:PorP/SprF family type IX secretion system membrane protein [Sediminibacterium sp.]|uniref:PorP/SprF family type IX secretion system membrane protein n=1 Tax=Sediminibacterium sp. TaxID=1917865 RepID=UPI0027311711|nr:PorP/SprF family type IX secretion system membrane protein [Sediminibacterium sp.]MDP2421364.1 PorP/SprF family type IX secretion system membrane protein [Sediminibacterium sp.]